VPLDAGAVVADAELVALGIGHLDPGRAELRADLGVLAARPEGFEPLRFELDVGGVEIDVHPVLPGLLLGHGLEQQLRRTRLRWEEHDVRAEAADVVVAERRRPERPERLRIRAVQHQSDLGHADHPC
jgi:hypothetical protein